MLAGVNVKERAGPNKARKVIDLIFDRCGDLDRGTAGRARREKSVIAAGSSLGFNLGVTKA
ncbi:MAG: hypothetical protein C4334_06040 [Pyrinomonas sp.]